MEKLIALLDEYEGPELEHTIIDGNVKRRVKNIVDLDKPYKWCSVWWYSKSFGFIKWLVDNDKIDLLKLTCMNPIYTEILDSDFSWEERIIMILSVQDNPIELLCGIIKK